MDQYLKSVNGTECYSGWVQVIYWFILLLTTVCQAHLYIGGHNKPLLALLKQRRIQEFIIDVYECMWRVPIFNDINIKRIKITFVSEKKDCMIVIIWGAITQIHPQQFSHSKQCLDW